MPLGVSLRIVADVCASLHAAHQLEESDGESLGVVHRDVSPQNIPLTTDGNAKVIDFGLVKAKNRTAGPTDSGVVKGKIRYMAPEQLGGRSIDRRADVWAAGMCLYELAVGHVPYDDKDDLDVIKRLMSDDPLPTFDAALPAPIQKILDRALATDPAGRFDFVSEVLPELATKRAKTIARALEAADARSSEADDGSSREGSNEEPLPLTRKRSDRPATPETSNRSRTRGTRRQDQRPPRTTRACLLSSNRRAREHPNDSMSASPEGPGSRRILARSGLSNGWARSCAAGCTTRC